MAEQLDPSQEISESSSTTPALRETMPRSGGGTLAASEKGLARSRRARRRAAGASHPVRSVLTVAAVVGLIATVALPAAFSAAGGASAEAAVTTLQQVAAENAQSLVVASEDTTTDLGRGGYSATTLEEIQAAKDEEAAAAAAAARIAAAAASTTTTTSTTAVAESIATAGSVVRPLTSFNSFGTPYAGHKGTDYMADRYTPIYAIADGVVVESSESGVGWGVYVKIAHTINGQVVTSLYAHMTYGTRRVNVGDTVTAGQLIGEVGDTGLAYGTHLHLEIYVNGSWVDAESWLVANVS
ncbi:MAG: M23 family metallopeptidase [Microbacterium sp.]